MSEVSLGIVRLDRLNLASVMLIPKREKAESTRASIQYYFLMTLSKLFLKSCLIDWVSASVLGGRL